MAHQTADRVRDTTTTTGTGSVTITGTAPIGYRTFSQIPGVATSDTFFYFIAHQTADEWEVGLGTYTNSTTLARTTVQSSSNAGSLVSFSAGTKDVVLSYTAASMLQANVMDQTITGGARVTSLSLTAGNITIDPGDRPLQYITNNGAFTITAPANDGSIMLLVTNGASAGAITFSGFSVPASGAGDTLTTTNTQKFTISVWRINGTSGYRILAHQ